MQEDVTFLFEDARRKRSDVATPLAAALRKRNEARAPFAVSMSQKAARLRDGAR